jgi:hypothetical protein
LEQKTPLKFKQNIRRKMKLIFNLLLQVILFTALANAQTVRYDVLRDDPSNIRKLQVRLQPLYVEGAKINIASLGTVLEARYNFNDKMFLTSIIQFLFLPLLILVKNLK